MVPEPKVKTRQWPECALAIGVSAVEQRIIPIDKVMKFTYVKSASHNQALTTDRNKIIDNPIHKQCNTEGVVKVVMMCSTQQYANLKYNKIMTKLKLEN